MINKITKLLLIFLLLIIPVKANASVYETDLIPIRQEVSFNYNDVNYSFNTGIMNISGIDRFTIYIKTNSSNLKDVESIFKFGYYNENKELISELKNNYTAVYGEKNSNLQNYNLTYASNVKYIKITLEDVKNSNASSLYDEIKDYNIDMLVNKDNTIDVTEKIIVNFYNSRDTFDKKINLLNQNKFSAYYNRVENLSINNYNYNTSMNNGILNVSILPKNGYFDNKTSFTLKYKINRGKDYINGKDKLIYDLVNQKFDYNIKHLSFKVNTPKDFDTSKLSISSRDGDIKLNINNNVITGEINDLASNDYIKLNATLPNNYFSSKGFTRSLKDYLSCIIVLAILGISFILYYLFGRDKKIIKTVEFYPPDNLNSLDIGYLYKGYIDNKDVISLLPYLASKGYIKIESLSDKKDLKITKLKDYDDNNIYEKTFLNGLLTSNEIYLSSLGNSFGYVVDNIRHNYKINNKNKLYNKKRDFILKLIIIILALTSFYISVLPLIRLIDDSFRGVINYFIPSTIFIFISIIHVFKSFVGLNENTKRKKWSILERISIIFYESNVLFMLFVFLLLMLVPFLLIDRFYTVCFLFNFICIFIIFLCAKYISLKSNYYTDIMGKVLGFRDFLEYTQTDKLNVLVKDNPNYFFDILPYTFVFDLSNVWLKNYEKSLTGQTPIWYDKASHTVVNVNALIGDLSSNEEGNIR